jgi:hypothetical protein
VDVHHAKNQQPAKANHGAEPDTSSPHPGRIFHLEIIPVGSESEFWNFVHQFGKQKHHFIREFRVDLYYGLKCPGWHFMANGLIV